jgi:uncharacterized small protein (DUF1192 family)
MTYPPFVVVFGDDGELHPVETENASNEAIEDGIRVLEERIEVIRDDIERLRRLLVARGHVAEVQPGDLDLDATVRLFRGS